MQGPRSSVRLLLLVFANATICCLCDMHAHLNCTTGHVRYLLARSSGGNGSTEEGGSSASEPGALAAAEAELARLRTQLRDAGA